MDHEPQGAQQHTLDGGPLDIVLLAAGTRPPSWVSEGFAEYCKRLPGECRLSLKEIGTGKRTKTAGAKAKEEEGNRMLSAIGKNAHVVALDRSGAAWSTEDLAGNLARWMSDFRTVNLLVGGPDGLADGCLHQSHQVWSLSALTFPHFLVRVIVAEQIYRAFSILANHPYHK